MDILLTPNDRRRIGNKFEEDIGLILKKTKAFIMNEIDIRREFGNNNSAIDHLLYYNDNIYFFQDKWRISKPTISDINHFIQCVNNIAEKTGKKCYAIYLSKMPLTKGGLDAFYEQNNKGNIFFSSISSEDQTILIKDLSYFLYEKGIYYYDHDNCLEMLE
jgi:pantothenate kinase